MQMSQLEGERGRGGDDDHREAEFTGNIDDMAYEQWFRAESMKTWFGSPGLASPMSLRRLPVLLLSLLL